MPAPPAARDEGPAGRGRGLLLDPVESPTLRHEDAISVYPRSTASLHFARRASAHSWPHDGHCRCQCSPSAPIPGQAMS
jgi:hypothetical protein